MKIVQVYFVLCILLVFLLIQVRTDGSEKQKVHFKIQVPEFVHKENHTKIIYVHVHHKDESKPKHDEHHEHCKHHTTHNHHDRKDSGHKHTSMTPHHKHEPPHHHEPPPSNHHHNSHHHHHNHNHNHHHHQHHPHHHDTHHKPIPPPKHNPPHKHHTPPHKHNPHHKHKPPNKHTPPHKSSPLQKHNPHHKHNTHHHPHHKNEHSHTAHYEDNAYYDEPIHNIPTESNRYTGDNKQNPYGNHKHRFHIPDHPLKSTYESHQNNAQNYYHTYHRHKSLDSNKNPYFQKQENDDPFHPINPPQSHIPIYSYRPQSIVKHLTAPPNPYTVPYRNIIPVHEPQSPNENTNITGVHNQKYVLVAYQNTETIDEEDPNTDIQTTIASFVSNSDSPFNDEESATVSSNLDEDNGENEHYYNDDPEYYTNPYLSAYFQEHDYQPSSHAYNKPNKDVKYNSYGTPVNTAAPENGLYYDEQYPPLSSNSLHKEYKTIQRRPKEDPYLKEEYNRYQEAEKQIASDYDLNPDVEESAPYNVVSHYRESGNGLTDISRKPYRYALEAVNNGQRTLRYTPNRSENVRMRRSKSRFKFELHRRK